ncbi:MAG: hypothetical protein HY275_04060 [Gemmatimonadetes bacterium]|nr:hypothetical protein [Gemmatimonadota bacterium]
MSVRRWLVIILSFASMIGLSIWIARAGIPPDSIKVRVPWWAHLLAFGAVVGEVVTRAYKIGWSANALNISLPIGLSIRTCLGGDFGATISPSRSGAEPARFLILAEGGLKPADVLMVLFLEIFLETWSLAVVAVILSRVGMMTASFLASIVHVAFRLTILPVLVLSLGATHAELSKLVMWPVMLLYGGPVAPLPGGGGVVELGFKKVFGGTIAPNILGASLVWWRFYTYYLYILLGGVAAGATVLRMMRRQDEQKRTGVVHRPGVPAEAPPSPRASGFRRLSTAIIKPKS